MAYKPPFTITPRILTRSRSISHLVGTLEGEKLHAQPLRLRRDSNIRTIHASLAIEGNTLSLEQVSAIMNGKRVIGPKKDILEVKNAFIVYDQFDQLNPLSIRDFLRAHRLMMSDLVDEAGKWRSGSVGVFKGKNVAHVAPQAKRVPILMKDLFNFLKNERDTPWLLKSCIFHYELEFVHPFIDGNGRMGRLWQQVILGREGEIFKTLSVEELIKNSQDEYYAVLQECDQKGESTAFIEYSLNQILSALQKYREGTRSAIVDPMSRLHYARKALGTQLFSRRDYLEVFKDISTSTASRDLALGASERLLATSGASNQMKYRFL